MVDRKVANRVRLSVLINCRVEGNENCQLFTLLDTLTRHTDTLDQLEVLLKFDTDDHQATSVINTLHEFPIVKKYIVEPRGRGYIDIHHGYNRLLEHISPSSVLIGAMADDFVVDKGWDTALLSLAVEQEFGSPFIIHQRPFPTMHGFDEGVYPHFLKNMSNAMIIDEAPFWSRELVFLTTWLGGGCSFTDAWTLALEYVLFSKYNRNITLFTDRKFISRSVNEKIDQPGGERWFTDRKVNFDYVASPYFQELVEHQARNVENAIKNSEAIV